MIYYYRPGRLESGAAKDARWQNGSELGWSRTGKSSDIKRRQVRMNIEARRHQNKLMRRCAIWQVGGVIVRSK